MNNPEYLSEKSTSFSETQPLTNSEPTKKKNSITAFFTKILCGEPPLDDKPIPASYTRMGYKESGTTQANYNGVATIGNSHLGDQKPVMSDAKKYRQKGQPGTQLGVTYILAPSPLGVGPGC